MIIHAEHIINSIDKIYLYPMDPYQTKYQLLVNMV